MQSFAHGEYNKKDFTDQENIEKKISLGKDIFDRIISYKRVAIDKTFPDYIVDNKEKLKEWII